MTTHKSPSEAVCALPRVSEYLAGIKVETTAQTYRYMLGSFSIFMSSVKQSKPDQIETWRDDMVMKFYQWLIRKEYKDATTNVIEKGQTRFLLFSPRTVEAIRVYLSERPANGRALFIGKRRNALTPVGIYQLLDRLAGAAQVTGRHNPHAFRHGWARSALARGADLGEVAQILGHRQVQTTYEFYGRWSTEELHQLHDEYTWLAED